MRKYSLLFGALGGALAGYLFSNTKLRKDLSDAKTAEEAGKILSKHLQHDGKKIGGEVKKFVESDLVQDNMKKMQVAAKDYFEKAKDEVAVMMKEAKMEAKKLEKDAKKIEKKAVKTMKKAWK